MADTAGCRVAAYGKKMSSTDSKQRHSSRPGVNVSVVRVQSVRKRRVPLVLWTLAFGLLVNFLPIFLPFTSGLPISFLGWVVPLLGSVFYLITRLGAVHFPLLLWLPWVLWVLIYLLLAEAENAIQRTIMLLTPLVVGTAFSTMRVDADLLDKCGHWLKHFVWIFLVGAGISSGLLVSGALYDSSGSAAGTITASLLAVWVAVGYAQTGKKQDLFVWGLLAFVPVAYITRMGMVAVALTLPLTFAPWSLSKRLITVALLVFASLAVFQLERVQAKMFYSGEGTIEQAVESVLGVLTGTETGDGDFRDNARKNMNIALSAQVKEAYWFGHGANTTEAITRSHFDGLTHPHNDWLRLQYEYGTLGMLLFASTLMLQALYAWRLGRLLKGEASRFMLTGAGAFVPMIMLMLTDNVILYVAWFGNLQFAMLGLGYAAIRADTIRRRHGVS